MAVSDTKLAEVYRQLATLFDAGVGPSKAVEALIKQAPRRLHSELIKVQKVLEKGEPLSRAFREIRNFPEADVAILEAAEHSGRLPDCLNRLAARLDRRIQRRRELMVKLTYPLLSYHLAVFVIATFRSLLSISDDGIEIALNLQAGIVTLLIFLGLPYAVFFFVFILWKQRQAGGLAGAMDRIVSLIPVLGSLKKKAATLEFLSSFRMLYEAGVGMSTCAEKARAAVPDRLLQDRLSSLSDALGQGESLDEALENCCIFNTSQMSMLHTGLSSGKLDEALLHIEKDLENDLNHQIAILSKIVPVLIFILVSAFIIYFIFQVYGIYIQELNKQL